METFGPRIHPYQHSGVPRGLSFKLSRVCFSGISRYARASSRAVPTGFSLLPSPSQIYRQYGNSILDERYSDYKSSHSGSRLTLWTTYAAFPRPMQFRTSSRRRELNCGFLLPPRFTFPRTPFVSGVSKTFHLHIFQLSAELILDSSWRFLATRNRTHHTPRVARTTLARRLHFVGFLHHLGWPEDDYKSENVSHSTRMIVMAAFAGKRKTHQEQHYQLLSPGGCLPYLQLLWSRPPFHQPCYKELAPFLQGRLGRMQTL